MTQTSANFVVTPFVPDPNDGLAAEHAMVSAWVTAAVAHQGEYHWYRDLDLKALPEGMAIFDAKPEQACRLVMAAVARARHLDRERSRVRAQAKDDFERTNAHHLPGWMDVHRLRQQTVAAIQALMRRTLPFQESDLLAILDWCNDAEFVRRGWQPLPAIVRAVERHASKNTLSPAMVERLRRFADRLRKSYAAREDAALATTVETLCGNAEGAAMPDEPDSPVGKAVDPPAPAPAGHLAVMVALKRYLGIALI